MHPRLASLALPCALLLAAGALAQGGLLGWGEPHLAAVPRTEAEAGRVAGALAPPASFKEPEPFEGLPGGAATVRARTDADAFSQASGNIDFAREMDFKLGNALFRRDWVSAPASTLASDGLGPLFNARACQSCHLKDGRGHPPAPGEAAESLFLRVSVPGEAADAHGIPGFVEAQPDPTYGAQVQTFGVQGQRAEARLVVTYEEREWRLPGARWPRCACPPTRRPTSPTGRSRQARS